MSIAARQAGGVSMIPCTPRQLEVFLAAAADCHFVSTANRLGISQAAVSGHIAALESQLGAALFIRRRGRKPVLSSFGLALLGEARSFSAEAGGVDGARARTESRQRRVIHVGAGGHLLDDCIKQRLPQFYRLHRDIDIECHYVDTPSQCVRLVKDRKIDMLVYTVPNPALIPLHAEILRSVKFGLYAGRRFAASIHASPEELSALPFILPPEGSSACALVRSALAEAGIVCRKVVAYVQFAPVAKDLAKQGEGIVTLFDTMVSADESEDLLKLDVELPTMYRALFRPFGAHDEAVANVESFLREALSH